MGQGIAMPAALAALGGSLLAWWAGGQGGTWLLPLVLMMAGLSVGVWRPRALVWLLLGGSVAFSIQQEWGHRLPVGLSGQDIAVHAKVTDVQQQSGVQRLRLSIERCTAPAHLPRCDQLNSVRVSAYDHEHEYVVGERWQMTLRLRPPYGFINPNTFDYEQWLWREGIHATGYIRPDPAPQQLTHASPRLRPLASDFLAQLPLEARTQRWLAALTLGDSEKLNQDDWALLNATGTTHLVVISGLHVGLVASFVLLLGRYAARCRLQNKTA